jgi:hypothetical protein
MLESRECLLGIVYLLPYVGVTEILRRQILRTKDIWVGGNDIS